MSKSMMARLDATATSWKPEVQTDSTGQWYGNSLRFATEAEAKASADALAMRWFAVREWRAAPSSDRITHRLNLETGEVSDERVTMPDTDPTRATDDATAADAAASRRP